MYSGLRVGAIRETLIQILWFVCGDDGWVIFMKFSDSRALVPVSSTVGAVLKAASETNFSLVRNDITFTNREEVRNHLPDILGRALARAWVDAAFELQFTSDPLQALADAGVHLPSNMIIEVSRTTADRPKIIVFEQQIGSKFKSRVLYLQLVMLAGK